MTTTFVILHGGAGADLHLLEYVRRVGLTLAFLGGVAVLAYSGLEVTNANRGVGRSYVNAESAVGDRRTPPVS